LKSKGKSKKGKEKEKEKEKEKAAENDPPKVSNLDPDLFHLRSIDLTHDSPAPAQTKKPFLPPAPESPTLVRQNVRPRTENTKPSTPPQKNVLSTSVKPLTTSPGRPCTPPGKNSEHHLSAARTPLSHLGVHMSPSASLAHYKSHLNPPPVTISLSHGDDTNPTTTTTNTKEGGHHGAEDSENLLRTPSRRRAGAGASQFTPFTPVTPRKLMFMGGVATESPLRGLFDHPHDPGTLLDEELARLGAQGNTPGRGGLHESPSVGFAQRALMYESPNTQSPERWTRMW
jgi:hypothetical protein